MAEKKRRRQQTFQMVVTDDFLEALDRWADAQRPPLSRAQAVRTAVYRVIEEDRGKK